MEGGNDVPVVHPDLTNQEIRETLIALARFVTTQDNFIMGHRVVKTTMTFSLLDYVRMNSPIFLCTKVGEDL